MIYMEYISVSVFVIFVSVFDLEFKFDSYLELYI